MKRILSLVLIVVFLLGLGGCKNKKQGKAIKISDLPENTFSSTFVYALDESDWYTSVTIKDDATFVGEYFTEKPENTGSDFPNGTVYYSHFSGKFTNIRKINDYTYSLTLEEVDIEDYIGKEVIENQLKNGVEKKLIAFEMTDRAIARHGYPIHLGEEEIGYVTSGCVAPFLNKNIGLGYIKTSKNLKINDTIQIMIRNKLYNAIITSKNFIQKHNKGN